MTGEERRYVLIDGYARARALRALARDEAEVRVLELSEAEALLRSFGLDNTRPRSALEEGWMLRALHDEHGLTSPARRRPPLFLGNLALPGFEWLRT